MSVATWIEEAIAESSDEPPSRAEELKAIPIEMERIGDNSITIYDAEGNEETIEFWAKKVKHCLKMKMTLKSEIETGKCFKSQKDRF